MTLIGLKRPVWIYSQFIAVCGLCYLACVIKLMYDIIIPKHYHVHVAMWAKCGVAIGNAVVSFWVTHVMTLQWRQKSVTVSRITGNSTVSTCLVFCQGNPPVFPHKRPVFCVSHFGSIKLKGRHSDIFVVKGNTKAPVKQVMRKLSSWRYFDCIDWEVWRWHSSLLQRLFIY